MIPKGPAAASDSAAKAHGKAGATVIARRPTLPCGSSDWHGASPFFAQPRSARDARYHRLGGDTRHHGPTDLKSE